MKRNLIHCGWLLLIFFISQAGFLLAAEENPFASAVRPTEALAPEEERLALQVPPGFKVQLFAAEPQIQKPINLAFDGRGRLWVTSTQDYPFVNLEHPGDSIRILEDTNGDGQADTVTTFVEGITHPMGLLPHKDGVIAFCIPNIEFFHDRDGDGKCDEREVLYGPFDYSKDTHGLNNAFRRGYDGWIYACHGFSNHSVVKGKDGNVLDVASGSTYRFRPDGSRIERFTFGQINPFGMTFDARGDLFNSDCHSKPLMLMLKDGQYPGFGRPHDGLGFAPEVLTHSHGSTAIAGVMQFTHEALPPDFRGNFLIGNVMTSRIHRDSLSLSGSSMKAIEEPDFLISQDPWFRPVDLQMGPDGAIYVADFYNKIIGHYEVALHHPGRDRTRGRIWRIVAIENERAPVTSQSLSTLRNLSDANLAELLSAAQTDNIPRQICALNDITDRLGMSSVPELKSLLGSNISDPKRTIAQWAMQRLGQLTFDELQTGLSSPSENVRIHSQRILADRAVWSASEDAAAISGLKDASAFVQRAAADALAQHPDINHVRPLLQLLQTITPADPMLEYQLKVAVRNQLRCLGVLARISQEEFHADDQKLLSTIAIGVDDHPAATFLLEQFRESRTSHLPATVVVGRIARWADEMEFRELIQLIHSQSKDDLEAQLSLLNTVREGFRQQGRPPSKELSEWAGEVAGKILNSKHEPAGWTVLGLTPGGKIADWKAEIRQGNDGQSQQMFSSLPGGEKSVSRLRSPRFRIPAQLAFLLCGHSGSPNQPASPLNYVHLCLVEGDQEIARQLPPRSDLTVKVQWDLTSHAGQEGYLEVVDGLDLSAYAWIAIGGIEPQVLSLPSTGFATAQQQTRAAIMLVNDFRLQQFEPALISWSADVSRDLDIRAVAIETLARWKENPLASALSAAWKSEATSAAKRVEIQQLLMKFDPTTARPLLESVVKNFPTREQVAVAQALLTRGGGEALLLDLCESNALSPQVLASSTVKPRLEQSRDEAIRLRLARMVQQLSSNSAAINQQIAQLVQQSLLRTADAAAGQKTFETRCAACHQIRGLGKVIGPQLDGIGTRGSERLLEDILDPNRNVDAAFRSRTYALADGKVYTGMLRRQEGALLVIANNQGLEISFPAAEVEQEHVSAVSIMPDNWSEVIPADELLALLAFLEQQQTHR